jgi:hypothetical protein
LPGNCRAGSDRLELVLVDAERANSRLQRLPGSP